MVRHVTRHLTLLLVVFALLPSPGGAVDDRTTVEVSGGTAAFDAATNISAITIHGKSTALQGRARIRRGQGALVIEEMEAVLPVNTLNTGLGLRDAHMRKHVFTTTDGQVPDLHFAAETATCEGSDAQSTCNLSGELSLRGTSRPFTITLKVTSDGGAFRAIGRGIVKLSEYGIPQPSQLGVKTDDEIKLHLDFVARPSSTPTAAGGDE